MPCSRIASSTGSPPRTWGIRAVLRALRELVRFTPTHVGNPTSAHQRGDSAAVHPPARGGSAQILLWDEGVSWFTPTHVGNPPQSPGQAVFGTAVHPHARGESWLPFSW